MKIRTLSIPMYFEPLKILSVKTFLRMIRIITKSEKL